LWRFSGVLGGSLHGVLRGAQTPLNARGALGAQHPTFRKPYKNARQADNATYI
jgi:hypothetical protein